MFKKSIGEWYCNNHMHISEIFSSYVGLMLINISYHLNKIAFAFCRPYV